MECFVASIAIAFVALLARFLIIRSIERREALRGPPGELESIELLARTLGGVADVPRTLLGAPKLEGTQLLARVADRRAWVEVSGLGPFTVTASVEVDSALDLEIKRPTLWRRKGSQRLAIPSDPTEDEQPDVRFDVRRARDQTGDVREELFIHAGDKLSEPLARLLYGLGADVVRASGGRLATTIEVRALLAERTREALAALGEIAQAYARRRVPPAIGSLVERYLWLDGGAPRCPYCHEDIPEGAPGLVACGRCGTLHHGECFAELGRCTLLGCGGARAP